MTTPSPADLAAEGAAPAPEVTEQDNDTTPATTPESGAEGDAGAPASGVGETTPEGDTFPREYVEELRTENANYRTRAADRDALAARLHTALVKLDGRLSDPAALDFDAAHLDDPAALESAITSLIEKSPGMRALAPAGDIGAGNRGSAAAEVDLIDFMRNL